MTNKEIGLAPQQTLAYQQYVDPHVFQEERKKIFRNNWVMVGHTSQVEKKGDYFTFEVAGEPLLISRGDDEEVRAFYNICPHRGARVEQTAEGNKKIFQCGYHGWTFKLDGQVHRTPNFKHAELGQHNCLTPIRLEIKQSLIFVNLNPDAPSLEETHPLFFGDLGNYPFISSLKKVRQNQRVIYANWKAVIDNYLECDHCSIAHPAFSKVFDMSNYSIVTQENFSYQYSKVKDSQEGEAARFYWLWPNLMISIYPGSDSGSMTTTQIIPMDEKTSLAIYTYYFMDEHLTEKDEELIKFVDQVRLEDFDLVELLQSGFHSQAFNAGIYSPSEHGLKHFHELINQAMQEA